MMLKNIEGEVDIAGVLHNIPECTPEGLECISYDYGESLYIFRTEEGIEHSLTLKAAEAATQKLIDDRATFCGWNPLDEGSYDAYVISAIVEVALFGERLTV